MRETKRFPPARGRGAKALASWFASLCFATSLVCGGSVAAHADDAQPTASDTLAQLQTIAPDTVAGVDSGSESDPENGVAVDSSTDSGATIVQIPSDPQDGIEISTPRNPAASIKIGLPRAEVLGDAQTPASGVAVYSAADGVATVPVAHDEGWIGINTVIPDVSSPSDYSYDISASASASLVTNDDGSVSVMAADGSWLGAIAPPWARDASGASVPTSFSVSGLTVTQHVDLSSPSLVFPVVADPDYVANSVDPAAAALKKTDDGYSFNYWLAVTRTTPSAVMDAEQTHFGADFPPLSYAPKTQLTKVGQVLETRLAGLRWAGVFSGHVKVTKLTSTGWTFFAEKDHPDSDGTIAFNFTKDSHSELDLTVQAHIPHGVAGGPFYYALTYTLWGNYGMNVQSRMHFTK